MIAEIDVHKTMRIMTKAKTTFKRKKRTPMIPIARGGRPKTPVKKSKNTALMKLTAAMAMLKTFVFLSMKGLMVLIATNNPSSRITRATPCVLPLSWANPMKRLLTKVYRSMGMMKKYICALNWMYRLQLVSVGSFAKTVEI